jgi:pimeloyl-ACP methyl ester carboxylesterase
MPPQNVDYTVQHIPGSRVIWIDDCGHMPMLEKPDEYHAILRDFLTV